MSFDHYACNIQLYFPDVRAHYKGPTLGTSHQWQQADQVTKYLITVGGYVAERARTGSSGSCSHVSSILPTYAVWPNQSTFAELPLPHQ